MGKAMILEISSKTKPTYHVLFITNQIGVHKGLDPIVLSEIESQFENNLFVYVFERVGKFQGKLNVLLHQALEAQHGGKLLLLLSLTTIRTLIYSYSKIARKH